MDELIDILKSVEFWTIAGAIGTILGVLLTVFNGKTRSKTIKSSRLSRRARRNIVKQLKTSSLILTRAPIMKGLERAYHINNQKDEYRKNILKFIDGTIENVNDLELKRGLSEFRSKIKKRRNTRFDHMINLLENSPDNQIRTNVFNVFKDVASVLMTEKVAASIEQNISESLSGFKSFRFRLEADNVFDEIFSVLISCDLISHRVSELTNEQFYQLTGKGRNVFEYIK